MIMFFYQLKLRRIWIKIWMENLIIRKRINIKEAHIKILFIFISISFNNVKYEYKCEFYIQIIIGTTTPKS